MRIIGIDPGLHLTGYGCVRIDPDAHDPILLDAGVIRLRRREAIELRLRQLHEDLTSVIGSCDPDEVVVEQIFSHYRHARTAMLMGHARGVILLAASQHDVPVGELAPSEIKKAVTGLGHASKQQMQHAVMLQCGLREPPSPPDVADAIAIALCAARRIQTERRAEQSIAAPSPPR